MSPDTKKVNEKEIQKPLAGFFFAGVPQSNKPMALTEIHGDEWCVLGNRRVSDLVDDPLGYSKRKVFGFSLQE